MTAAPDYVFDNSLEDVPMGQLRPLKAAYFADPNGIVGTENITAQTFLTLPCFGRFPIEGPHGAVWLRFSLSNPHDSRVDWVLAFMETVFDEMALYEQTETGLLLIAENGRALPQSRQSHVGVKTALPVSLSVGESKVLYIKVSGTFARNVTPLLVSAEMFERWNTSFETILIVLMGLMAVFAILSLILFRNVVSHFYKYYTLYMIAAFLFIFVVYGWVHRLLGVQWPVTVSIPIVQLVTGMGIFANIQYCRVLLGTGNRPRGQTTSFVILTAAAVLMWAVAVLDPWRFALPNHLMLFVSPIILLIFAGRRLGSGPPQVLPLCGSLICLIFGLAISNYYFLFAPPIAETSSVTEIMLKRAGTYSYAFAIIGEAMFMMLAISRMLQEMRNRSELALDEIERLRHSLRKAEAENAKEKEKAEARARYIKDMTEDQFDQSSLHADGRLEQRARKTTLDHISTEGFSAQTLAAEMGISERTLSRRMKDALDITPAAFIRQTRLNLARDLIMLRHYRSVSEVAYAVGFSSVSHFAKLYRAEFQETPRETFKSVKQAATTS